MEERRRGEARRERWREMDEAQYTPLRRVRRQGLGLGLGLGSRSRPSLMFQISTVRRRKLFGVLGSGRLQRHVNCGRAQGLKLGLGLLPPARQQKAVTQQYLPT